MATNNSIKSPILMKTSDMNDILSTASKLSTMNRRSIRQEFNTLPIGYVNKLYSLLKSKKLPANKAGNIDLKKLLDAIDEYEQPSYENRHARKTRKNRKNRKSTRKNRRN